MNSIYYLALVQIGIGLVLVFNKVLPGLKRLNPANESLIPIIGLILIGLADILLVISTFGE